MKLNLVDPSAVPAWLLDAYPFRRRAALFDGLKVNFVDQGEGRPVLMLHGNPTWSFLWRKVIQQLSHEPLRLIAPDLIGFGLSDKPDSLEIHSLDFHVTTMLRLVEGLDLQDILVVGQDWGGPIAAGVAARSPARVTGAVFGNTTLLSPRRPLKTAMFHRVARTPVLSTFLFRGLNFPVPVLNRVQGDRHSIGSFERRAYAFPFPRYEDRAGPLALARMVPGHEQHPSLKVLEETDAWARSFRGSSALVWGLKDPVLGGGLRRMRDAFPAARVLETQAGHFLQEEVPEQLAAAILEVANRRSTAAP